MDYSDALKFAGGTQVALARLLGINQSAVSRWGKVVPPHYQFHLHVLSRGSLRVDPKLLPQDMQWTPEELRQP